MQISCQNYASQLYSYSKCEHLPTRLHTHCDLVMETSRIIQQQNKNSLFQFMVMYFFNAWDLILKSKKYIEQADRKFEWFSVDAFCSQSNTVLEAMGYCYHFAVNRNFAPVSLRKTSNLELKRERSNRLDRPKKSFRLCWFLGEWVVETLHDGQECQPKTPWKVSIATFNWNSTRRRKRTDIWVVLFNVLKRVLSFWNNNLQFSLGFSKYTSESKRYWRVVEKVWGWSENDDSISQNDNWNLQITQRNAPYSSLVTLHGSGSHLNKKLPIRWAHSDKIFNKFVLSVVDAQRQRSKHSKSFAVTKMLHGEWLHAINILNGSCGFSLKSSIHMFRWYVVFRDFHTFTLIFLTFRINLFT